MIKCGEGLGKEKLKNEYRLRIKNKDILEEFCKLLDSKVYSSANDLLNDCVKRALPSIFEDKFGKLARREKRDQERGGVSGEIAEIIERVGMIERLLSQVFVKNFMGEKLMSVLYNIEYFKSKGIKIETQHFDNRVLEELPDSLAVLEQEMIRQLEYLGGDE